MGIRRITLFGVVIASFFLLISIALAQESVPSHVNPTPLPMIEYALPYPGILPDHPLYIIKAFRDALLSALITNPIRKIEFSQLLADKHSNMGVFLLAQQKEDLALQMFEKGVVHLQTTKALIDKLPASTDQAAVEAVTERFKKSKAKHFELISQIASESAEAERNEIEELRGKIEQL